jgi:hypothetical protein
VFDKSSENFMKPTLQNSRNANVWRSLLKTHSPAVLRVLFIYQGLPTFLMKGFSSALVEGKTEAVLIIDDTNFPCELVPAVVPYLSMFQKSRKGTPSTNFLDACASFRKK